MRSGFVRILSSLPARNLKISFAFLLFACAAVFAPQSRADNLQFYKNYFVTGDYAVAGVGLYGQGVNGNATGTINMSGVPAGADIVAAYLYWQTVESTAAPSSFNGTFDSQAIVGDSLGNPAEPACWSSGGTSPQVSVRVYRADVLRYLPIDSVNSVRLVNGEHTVSLPDSGGNGNGQTPHTDGASLVVIYRMLAPGAAPLKAVVMYDGAATMSKSSPPMIQLVGGFYQATGGAGANMTQIVGNGQPGFNATLSVNLSPITSAPFIGALGGRWDNYTFPISKYVHANDFGLETQTVAAGNQVCLSWASIITSTPVVNSDNDGILDVWKSNTLAAAHIDIDPTGHVLPDLDDMGAKHGQKDVFIQIDWMQGTDGHLHMPKLAALSMVAAAFSQHGIMLHFDVGNNYQKTPPLPYILPAKYAQGGQVIQETSLLCPNGQTSTCSFTEPYSVLSWKKGFDAVKSGFPALTINPHFAHTRKDIFHYILMGHALAGPFDATGKPLATDPSSVSGVADRPGGDLMVTLGLWRTDNAAGCVQSDPTGVNTNICTDQTGTVLVQAGTIMHELGHNLGLSHGGAFRVPNCMPDYPSVMNYLYQTRGLTDAGGIEHIDYSSGLLGPLNENSLSEVGSLGTSLYRIRYYGPPSALGSIAGESTAKAHCDGTPLVGDLGVRLESPTVGTIPDWNNNGSIDPGPYAEDINFNGTTGDPVNDSVDSTLPAGNPAKRWFVDSNDWGSLNLQQVGARLNVDGLSVDVGQSDLGQSDLGQSDLGQSDLGQSDLGQSDLGQSDLGQSDLGQSDLGDVDYNTAISTLDATGSDPSSLLGTTDLIDRISMDWGAPGLGQIRTYTIYRSNAATPSVTPIVVGTVSGAPPATVFSDVVNDFSSTDSGATCPPTSTCYNTTYNYFLTSTDIHGTTSGPSNGASGLVEHLFVTATSQSVVYGNALPTNFPATITGLALPAPFTPTCALTPAVAAPVGVGSYPIVCTGPNPADVAGIDGVTYVAGTLMVTARPLLVTAAGVNKVYDGTTAATVVLTGNPITGDVLTYSYTTATFATKNVGTGIAVSVKGISIGGSASGNYSFNTTAATTANITQRPLTINATGINKVYDGGTKATVTLSDNRVLNVGDTFTDTYTSATFATKNVGTGIAVSVSGICITGTGAGNYTYNTTAATTANITPHPLTITAVANIKKHDGNTSAKAIPTVSGLQGTDTVTGLAEVYNSATIGKGKTMTVSAYTINDGNNGLNYTVTTVVNKNGGITDADGDYDND